MKKARASSHGAKPAVRPAGKQAFNRRRVEATVGNVRVRIADCRCHTIEVRLLALGSLRAETSTEVLGTRATTCLCGDRRRLNITPVPGRPAAVGAQSAANDRSPPLLPDAFSVAAGIEQTRRTAARSARPTSRACSSRRFLRELPSDMAACPQVVGPQAAPRNEMGWAELHLALFQLP